MNDFYELTRLLADIDGLNLVNMLSNNQQSIIVGAIKRALREALEQVSHEVEREREALTQIKALVGVDVPGGS